MINTKVNFELYLEEIVKMIEFGYFLAGNEEEIKIDKNRACGI